MFSGHYAVGFAAKKINTKPSLGTYFLACQFLDLLWPTLLLLKVEKVEIVGPENPIPLSFTSYPVSHSLLMVVIWAMLLGVVYWFFKKDMRAALIVSLVVVSHWFLDLLVHIPDLPLYAGNSPLVGFGLWKLKTITLLIESLMFIAGVVMYANVTKASNKVGSIAFWCLVVFLFAIHIANAFGAPPPNVNAVAWAGQLQWIFVIWAYRVDANRKMIKHEPLIIETKFAFS